MLMNVEMRGFAMTTGGINHIGVSLAFYNPGTAPFSMNYAQLKIYYSVPSFKPQAIVF